MVVLPTSLNDRLAARLGAEKVQAVCDVLATLTPEQAEAVRVYGDSRHADGYEEGECEHPFFQ